MKKIAAVIVAGGSGSRMGTAIKKQYLKIQGKEVLVHAVQAFEQHKEIDEIIVVTGEADKEDVSELLNKHYPMEKVKEIVVGGKERQHSVYNGLKALSGDIAYVLIHDGARPMIAEKTITACIASVKTRGSSVVGVPVKDTIKIVGGEGQVVDTPRRDLLWSIQTPQAFRKDIIMRAHDYAKKNAILGTDDSMLVEATGESVYMVEGAYTNIKITTPEDMVVAEQLLGIK